MTCRWRRSSPTPRRSSMPAPCRRPSEIARRYADERGRPGFDLRAFVAKHFEPPRPAGEGVPVDTSSSHGAAHPAAVAGAHAAGGCSRALFVAHPAAQPVRGARRPVPRGLLLGFVLHDARPGRERANGSRARACSTTSRIWSAPSATSRTAIGPTTSGAASRRTSARWSASTRGRRTAPRALRYLDALEAEHAFWMDGASRLAPGTAYRRVVRLRDGAAAQPLLGRHSGAAARVVP